MSLESFLVRINKDRLNRHDGLESCRGNKEKIRKPLHEQMCDMKPKHLTVNDKYDIITECAA